MRASLRDCIVAGLLMAPVVAAIADDGKSRYVSGSGQDSGDCLNKFRPCRSLSYAISFAGKGDTIAVAEGSYDVRTARELSDLLAVQGRLVAGYDKFTGFSDRTATDKTTLVGVPPELRERFEHDGFTVIVDTKSLFESAEARVARESKSTLATTVREAGQSHKAAPCSGNVSSGFPCQNVSLHAHLALEQLKPASTAGNDVWGFVDLNSGREYAFMGLQNGVAIVDIANPAAPEQVVFSTGSATTWRDIKVYQRYDTTAKRWRAYAYATADNVQDFLMVLDLSGLPNTVERVDYSSDFRAAHNEYLVNTDYTFGLAQSTEVPRLGISGSNLGTPRGSHRLYSLTNPRSPTLTSATSLRYSHDMSSYAVKDARKNAQCVNAAAASACDVIADFNETHLDVWDVTNASSPQLLASHEYANRGYTHSGWWSEDGRYVFLHDELDEQRLGLFTTLRVFDMQDLRAPTLAGTWVGPTRAIDHNGYVKGNRYYISNYSEGLTVLDITNPTAPQRIAYFDTYPAGSPTTFVGAWGVYPFFASGTIAVGDINSGLYLLKNEALASPSGTFAVSSRVVSGAEGSTLQVPVTRTGGSIGAVSVQVELLYGNASAADASSTTTVLNWVDGDTTPKSIALNLLADGANEDTELFFARLKNPQGGATLNYPDTAYVYVTEPGATTRLRALDVDVRTSEIRGKAFVTVTRTGSLAGAAQISYRTLPAGAYTGFTAKQGDLAWANGDPDAKTIQIDVDPAVLFDGETGTFQVELFAPTNAALESANAQVTALTATVTILGEGTRPVVNPPPPIDSGGGKKSGGGEMSLWWLAMLAVIMSARALHALQQKNGMPVANEGGVMRHRADR